MSPRAITTQRALQVLSRMQPATMGARRRGRVEGRARVMTRAYGFVQKSTAGPDGERKPSETVSPSLAATGGNGDLGDAVSRRFAAAKRCSSFCTDPKGERRRTPSRFLDRREPHRVALRERSGDVVVGGRGLVAFLTHDELRNDVLVAVGGGRSNVDVACAALVLTGEDRGEPVVAVGVRDDMPAQAELLGRRATGRTV